MNKFLLLIALLVAAVGANAQQLSTVSDTLLGASGTLTITAGATFTTFDGSTILVGQRRHGGAQANCRIRGQPRRKFGP